MGGGCIEIGKGFNASSYGGHWLRKLLKMHEKKDLETNSKADSYYDVGASSE